MKYYLDKIIAYPNDNERILQNQVARYLGVSPTNLRVTFLGRRSILVQNKLMICYQVVADTLEFVRNSSIRFHEGFQPFQLLKYAGKGTPLVVGAGFTGLFSAYLLAKSGAKPLLIEQGARYQERERACTLFESRFSLDAASNYLCGEGGRASCLGGYIEKNQRNEKEAFVLSCFQELGLFSENGLDNFLFVSPKKVFAACEKMERIIASSGGEILYQAKLVSIERFLGWPKSVTVLQNGTKKAKKISQVIFASGTSNSSLTSLAESKVLLKPAEGEISLFVEMNGRDFETEFFGRGSLGKYPPLFVHDEFLTPKGKKVKLELAYPNAELVNATTDENEINLQVRQKDSGSLGNAIAVFSVPCSREEERQISLDGSFIFGKKLLSEAYRREKPYCAPSESLGDFLSKKEPLMFGSVKPSYRGGVYLTALPKMMPPFLFEAFAGGISTAAHKYPCLSKSGLAITGFSNRGCAKAYPIGSSSGSRGIYSALPTSSPSSNLLQEGLNALEAVTNLLKEG